MQGLVREQPHVFYILDGANFRTHSCYERPLSYDTSINVVASCPNLLLLEVTGKSSVAQALHYLLAQLS